MEWVARFKKGRISTKDDLNTTAVPSKLHIEETVLKCLTGGIQSEDLKVRFVDVAP
jgi:hypothetical protein